MRRGKWAGHRPANACASAGPIWEPGKDAHRPSDILEALLAQIDKLDRDFAENLIVSRSRDADATRFGDALKTGRNIYTVAKMSCGSTVTSPILMPTRKRRRLSSASPIVSS
jgi:hypothetical protein